MRGGVGCWQAIALDRAQPLVSVRGFSFGNNGGRPALLRHSIKVVQRAFAIADRLGVRDRGRNVGLGEQNGLR